jgi:Tfp pilus assembly protein PilO
MTLDSKGWKKWVRWGLGVLLVLDLALVVVDWRAGLADAQQQAQQAHLLAGELVLLQKDVERADAIRAHLPAVRGESDRFYTDELLTASTGYSAVVADLGDLAAHSGLKTTGVQFEQQIVKNRGVTEVQIRAAVEGDYPSLIQFINGLERSKNFYLLDTLSLASATSGSIKLNLTLRTYFRS